MSVHVYLSGDQSQKHLDVSTQAAGPWAGLGWAQERFCLVFRRYIVIDRLLKKYG